MSEVQFRSSRVPLANRAPCDSHGGRQQTQQYHVEGPVAMLLTTTAEAPDPELANRCIRLAVNEQPAQTAAIQQRPRQADIPNARDSF